MSSSEKFSINRKTYEFVPENGEKSMPIHKNNARTIKIALFEKVRPKIYLRKHFKIANSGNFEQIGVENVVSSISHGIAPRKLIEGRRGKKGENCNFVNLLAYLETGKINITKLPLFCVI